MVNNKHHGVIKLEAEIDLSKEEAEVRVKRIDNPHQDWAYYLEVAGFMTFEASKYNEETLKSSIEYAKNYIDKSARDYKHKLTDN